jgi:two-component system NtrC family sensor kinase
MRIMIDKDSSELLRTLDVLNMPAFIVDKDRTILSCNDNTHVFFEYDRSEVIGRNLEKFISVDGILRERETSGLSPEGAGREGESPSVLRSFCFRKNGGPVAARIAVIPSRDHRQDRTIVIVRDVSGQRTASAAGSGHPGKQPGDRTAQGELISELSSIINSSLSIGTIFRMVVSELRKIIDYSRASLLLYNENDDNLLIFALDTEMKTVMKKGVKAPIEGTSAGWVVRNNKPWISYDLNDTAFPLDRKLLREGIRSTISIPLFHDRMLGVFNFDSTRPSQYSEKDLEILLPVAKHIAVALENALLFEEISREKKEWERTFDAITDMVWIEDGRQQVVRANHTLLLRTGYSKSEITDKHCVELLDKIGIALSNGCLCSETLSGKKPSFQEIKSGSGNIFHFWAYPLIDEEGRLYAIVHYLKDVTAQKRLEQQLIRSDKLASLGTLVAGIAHEINNPLGIIAGYSEALLDRANEKALNGLKAFEDFPEYLRTIHNEIFRCKTILKSLLEFARPSGGTFREIDINELIKEVLLLLQHRTARLKHTLELDLDREVPKIYADAGSLRQLLMNLLLNAIYFTPEGGTISIKTEPDDGPAPGAVDCPSRIRLSVRDTGAGIPPDLIDKVFDPFFTTKPVGEGTGLGLTICHRIVEEHRGAIYAESDPGRGAAFIITLPSIACRE